jgi:23S rRNA pseudouridine1911/1915/1917 synthase
MPTKGEKLVYADPVPARLDRFLVGHFKGLSRAYVAELIQTGLVRVNGVVSRKGKTLSTGDAVEVEPFLKPEERRIDPNPEIPLNIVWQSADLIVIDKQAGLPTHPNDYSDRETLANALIARFPEVSEVGDDRLRPGIVHRLDTDTSGLILVARNQESFRYVRSLFDERKIKKTYAALVLGEVPSAGEIDTPVAHHPTNPRRMIAVTREVERREGFRSRVREARTLYEPVERFSGYTLLHVRTLTGRMHQVRVHLSSIGHPLAGDRLYQTSKERGKDHLGLPRHFLHAIQVKLQMNDSNEWKSFESDVSPDLIAGLEKLRRMG